jgi:hypothetical protein
VIGRASGGKLRTNAVPLEDTVDFQPPVASLPRPSPVEAVAPAAALPFEREPDRFELKYWIPEELTHKIVEYAQPYLIVDPYSVKLGIMQQANTSLYLETAGLDAYRTHTDKSADRYKLRIRAYGDPPRGMTFFETKRKVNTRCVKTRTPVPMEHMKALLDGTYRSLPSSLSAMDRRHLEMFLYAQEVTQAEPYVLVRAFRESFCSEDPLEDIRMTFDRRIGFQRARDASFDSDPEAWTPLDGEEQHGMQGPHAMVELKFPGIAPFWMRKVVEQLEMCRVGYSKYISSVNCLLEQEAQDMLSWDASGDLT